MAATKSKTVKRNSNWYPTGSLQDPYLPQEISSAMMAFPAGVGHLMPLAEDIPEEFCTSNYDRKVNTKKGSTDAWLKMQDDWFYGGLTNDTEFFEKEGIDPGMAIRHLAAIQGSFEPKHEYKAAAVAYLASLWLEGWKK